jgi:hypothetical protein
LGDVDPSELELIDFAHAFSAELGLLRLTWIRVESTSFIGPNNIDKVDDYHGSFEDGNPNPMLDQIGNGATAR